MRTKLGQDYQPSSTVPCFVALLDRVLAGGRYVGIEQLIEADDSHPSGHIFGDHGLRTDSRSIPDIDVSKDSASSAQHNAIGNFGVSIAALFSSAAQGNRV